MMITREVSELAEEERDADSGESTKIPGSQNAKRRPQIFSSGC